MVDDKLKELELELELINKYHGDCKQLFTNAQMMFMIKMLNFTNNEFNNIINEALENVLIATGNLAVSIYKKEECEYIMKRTKELMMNVDNIENIH